MRKNIHKEENQESSDNNNYGDFIIITAIMGGGGVEEQLTMFLVEIRRFSLCERSFSVSVNEEWIAFFIISIVSDKKKFVNRANFFWKNSSGNWSK
jgi:hypothetical protein